MEDINVIEVAFDRAEVTQEAGQPPKLTYYGSAQLNGHQVDVEHVYDERHMYGPCTIVKADETTFTMPYMLCARYEPTRRGSGKKYWDKIRVKGPVEPGSFANDVRMNLHRIQLGAIEGEEFADKNNAEFADAKSSYKSALKEYTCAKEKVQVHFYEDGVEAKEAWDIPWNYRRLYGIEPPENRHYNARLQFEGELRFEGVDMSVLYNIVDGRNPVLQLDGPDFGLTVRKGDHEFQHPDNYGKLSSQTALNVKENIDKIFAAIEAELPEFISHNRDAQEQMLYFEIDSFRAAKERLENMLDAAERPDVEKLAQKVQPDMDKVLSALADKAANAPEPDHENVR